MTSSIPKFANTGPNPTQGTSEVAASQLRGQINSINRLRYAVFFLASAVAAAGGTDYTSALAGSDTGTLRRDTQDALAGFDMDTLDALEAYIWLNSASSLGGSPGSTASAWEASSKALKDVSEDDLKRMKVFLVNALAVRKF